MSYSFPCPQLYISTNQNWYSTSNTPWSKYAEYMLGRRCLRQRPGEWQFTRPWQTEVKAAVYLSLTTWDLFPQLWEPNYVCSLHSIVTIYNNYISNNYLIKYLMCFVVLAYLQNQPDWPESGWNVLLSPEEVATFHLGKCLLTNNDLKESALNWLKFHINIKPMDSLYIFIYSYNWEWYN